MDQGGKKRAVQWSQGFFLKVSLNQGYNLLYIRLYKVVIKGFNGSEW